MGICWGTIKIPYDKSELGDDEMFYGFGYDTFNAIFSFVFLIAVAVIVVVLVKGVAQWHENNEAPRLTVEARVVNKREDIHYEQHANAGDITGAHGYHTTTSVVYFVTFQVESGDQMRFVVNSSEYEMLQEGMSGRVSFQGSRFLGFEKE